MSCSKTLPLPLTWPGLCSKPACKLSRPWKPRPTVCLLFQAGGRYKENNISISFSHAVRSQIPRCRPKPCLLTKTTGQKSADHICNTKDNKEEFRRCGKEGYSQRHFLSVSLNGHSQRRRDEVAVEWKCDFVSLLRAYCDEESHGVQTGEVSTFNYRTNAEQHSSSSKSVFFIWVRTNMNSFMK